MDLADTQHSFLKGSTSMPAVTINTSDGSRSFTAAWADADGNPVSAPDYSFANWKASDNGAIVSLRQIGFAPAGKCIVTMTPGAIGTFTLTATSSKADAPDLVGTIEVTVEGQAVPPPPVASQLVITLDPLPVN
jgi:hypothetical protein